MFLIQFKNKDIRWSNAGWDLIQCPNEATKEIDRYYKLFPHDREALGTQFRIVEK